MRSFLVALVLTLGAINVCAYVQSRHSDGTPLTWVSSPIDYAINERGSREIADGSEFVAIVQAFSSWQVVPNSSLSFSRLDDTPDIGLVQDGTSSVGWIEDPAEWAFQSVDVGARTLVHRQLGTSNIAEADIVLNGATFSWATSATGGGYTSNGGPLDVQAVVTHEVGHFIGLSHVPTPTSTMFPRIYPGSIGERDLTQDEVSAVQFVYPGGGTDTTVSGIVTRGGNGVAGAYVTLFQGPSSNIHTHNWNPGSYVRRKQY